MPFDRLANLRSRIAALEEQLRTEIDPDKIARIKKILEMLLQLLDMFT